MSKLGIAIAVSASAVVFAAPLGAGHASAPPPAGTCAGGEFRWTATDGAITMTPQLLTFTSVGVLRDCTGGPAGITDGTFTGTHTAWSDCTRPADGPITIEISWSNGETSTLSGQWLVTLTQPAVGPLEVIDGLGRGSQVMITADYEATPEMVGGCLGPGVRTGVGRVSGSIFQ